MARNVIEIPDDEIMVHGAKYHGRLCLVIRLFFCTPRPKLRSPKIQETQIISQNSDQKLAKLRFYDTSRSLKRICTVLIYAIHLINYKNLNIFQLRLESSQSSDLNLSKTHINISKTQINISKTQIKIPKLRSILTQNSDQSAQNSDITTLWGRTVS